MARLTRLVYPVFEVKNLAKWQPFAEQMYGLPIQSVSGTEDHEVVIDSTGCRLILRQGKADDLVGVGWETDDIDGLFDRLSTDGVNPVWLDAGASPLRGSEKGFMFLDPDGLPVEVIEQSNSANPFVPSSHGLSFQAGEMGFGHLTVMSKNFDAMEQFYRSYGLGVSDYVDWEIIKGLKLHLAFMHANARHHSLAVGRMPVFPKRLHHFMLEVEDRHQVGVSFDRIRKAGIKVKNEIGVHPNDKSFTFYVKSPSGFEAELGAEGIQVNPEDPDREVGQYYQLSIWGHKMTALDTLPLKAAATYMKLTGND
ncbi:MAG: hypothetical protein F4171_08345 [Gammaproteobacteria bacterium]|nr:hypothetical protein [Gammaproteobacteria bacterium]